MSRPHPSRYERLMPNGIPRWVRVYDNGGRSFDRYTVVFTGKRAAMRAPGRAPQFPYLGMSEHPFHPQGFGQHGHSDWKPCDVTGSSWGGAAMGRSNHLGKRIPFSALPPDCQRLVLSDYREIWGLA